MIARKNSFRTLRTDAGQQFVDMHAADACFPGLNRLPISLRLLFENMLRNEDGTSVTSADIEALARRAYGDTEELEIAFYPTRVLMQDYAGMPALIDLAALRDYVASSGLSVQAVNPRVRTDVVVDHSIIVHDARSPQSLGINQAREIEDNYERFAFLKWAQQAFDNLRIVPPGQGIVHQINLEYLADVVSHITAEDGDWLVPDTLIGTDSHTPMINGLGVLGWGVGGIEAEAVMMGEAVSMLVPPVIGVRLTGSISEGILATDIVLSLTECLRKRGVVGAFLEFFGPGVAALSVADRATIANMTPEFGATISLFPCDSSTMRYLALTGRTPAQQHRTQTYLQRNGFWRNDDVEPLFADVVEFNLSTVGRVASGPARPEQRRDLSELPGLISKRPEGAAIPDEAVVRDGDIVIAAITSCTNTSNPVAMLAAGLLARKARILGLNVPDHVKTSLAPGSRVVADYLQETGLMEDLSALGFDLVGFGCTTCVGNSGELAGPISTAIDAHGLDVAAVLSGNRNFEARIHSKIKSNFLVSPPLVVAYALAGTVLRDLTSEPIGISTSGNPVHLSDIWPTAGEIETAALVAENPERFAARYSGVFDGGPLWADLPADTGERFSWAEESTYFKRPPFFDMPPVAAPHSPVLNQARPLLLLGDSVTTDHISPVGSIGPDSPAGQYLVSLGVERESFNTYGARRGNHQVMARGTFANPRLKNRLAESGNGNAAMTVFSDAENFAQQGCSAVVIAGKNYGAGSARDWAAKGTRLLGVSAILAESFERIHRSNLVRMGVLPLQFPDGFSVATLNLGREHRFSIATTMEALEPRMSVRLEISGGPVDIAPIDMLVRIDTAQELRYFQNGGILQSIAGDVMARASVQG
ncbi:aconitate hydratase AcnA [Aureimonas fodinaquatilis]|uniref:Aconitate hydratase n=1 Tax=Aureimonas fodinaquatilis TaxID=2565783 RepID=A0A5B0DMX1_9HYPH|nr:aconitate hydratase AcnA [Aureimonas fodinaquatilis]KAA0968217.1 aconitate hydratase AcnA [Aureimonas fodinaquatilis]